MLTLEDSTMDVSSIYEGDGDLFLAGAQALPRMPASKFGLVKGRTMPSQLGNMPKIFGRLSKYDGEKKDDFKKTLERLESRSKTINGKVL